MATGVLICGIGKGTKLLTYVSGATKAYTATIRLGIATTTDDAEGEITETTGISPNTRAAIPAAIADLTGEISQVPTAVSAIKVNGKRAYDLVRQGAEVALAARPVTVSEFQLISAQQLTLPTGVPVIDLEVAVTVSSGTYVRALARDLGEALGVGGHLTALRRTRIGNVTLADAKPLAALEDIGQLQAEVGEPLSVIPLAIAAQMFLPSRTITAAETTALRLGKFIDIADTDTITAAVSAAGELVAIIEPATAAKAKPKVVFPWVP